MLEQIMVKHSHSDGIKSVHDKPDTGDLDLSLILDALSDPTRRRIVLRLSGDDFCCSSFAGLGPKTRLTYHFARLRDAGLILSTKSGRRRILSLRLREVEDAFPGLLPTVLRCARLESRP